jgi:hypothetical protein
MTNWTRKNYRVTPETPSISFFLLGTKINLTYICVYNVLTTPRAFVN